MYYAAETTTWYLLITFSSILKLRTWSVLKHKKHCFHQIKCTYQIKEPLSALNSSVLLTLQYANWNNSQWLSGFFCNIIIIEKNISHLLIVNLLRYFDFSFRVYIEQLKTKIIRIHSSDLIISGYRTSTPCSWLSNSDQEKL